MSDIYSTNQAAEIVGISADTIRTWKRRYSQQLRAVDHWIRGEKNALFWTAAGIEALKLLQNGDELPSSSTVNCDDVQTELDSSSLLNRYEPLLEMLADVLAPQLIAQLDTKVLVRFQDLSQTAEPLTSIECVNLLQQLGLSPANPSELLGHEVQALPQSNSNQ